MESHRSTLPFNRPLGHPNTLTEDDLAVVLEVLTGRFTARQQTTVRAARPRIPDER